MNDDVVKFLKKNGYNGPQPDPIWGKDGVTYMYKAVPGVTKHQVVVEHWPSPDDRFTNVYEVNMSFENASGIWSEVRFYGISEDDLKNQLDNLEQKLYDGVVAMGANPDHYRFEGEI